MSGKSLKDKAYTIIKDKIVRCEFAPGQVLAETELMDLVGASRTPIREALNKLEQERLVKIMPKRGVFVEDITMACLQDVYEVRELVEPYTIRCYGHRVPKARLLELSQAAQALSSSRSPEEHYAFDNDLHLLLIQACENSYLNIMMDQIYFQNTRIRIVSGTSFGNRFSQSLEEHKIIIACLLEEQYEQAAVKMLDHLKTARQVAISAISKRDYFSIY